MLCSGIGSGGAEGVVDVERGDEGEGGMMGWLLEKEAESNVGWRRGMGMAEEFGEEGAGKVVGEGIGGGRASEYT